MYIFVLYIRHVYISLKLQVFLVELSKMSTNLSTLDNFVDNGHFCGHFRIVYGQWKFSLTTVDIHGLPWTTLDIR
jgi:hypothetical protein